MAKDCPSNNVPVASLLPATLSSTAIIRADLFATLFITPKCGRAIAENAGLKAFSARIFYLPCGHRRGLAYKNAKRGAGSDQNDKFLHWRTLLLLGTGHQAHPSPAHD
jgi:hypothetical protein